MLYDFLGVDSTYKPDLRIVNESLIPKHISFRHILKLNYIQKMRKWFNSTFNSDTIRQFKKIYDSIIYSDKRKVEMDDNIEESLKQELKSNVKKLDNLLHNKQLIDPRINLLHLWNFNQ
jgi:hypothetical protein